MSVPFSGNFSTLRLFSIITAGYLTSVKSQKHIPLAIYPVQEEDGAVLAFSVPLGQPDQGSGSLECSRSFWAAFGCSEKFIPSQRAGRLAWPQRHLSNGLPSTSGGQPGVWSLGLSGAAMTDRQQGAEDLLWLLEKQQQQQQQAPLESSPASEADAGAPLPRDPHRRVKQQVIDGFPN